MSAPKPLSEYLEPELSPARLARNRAAIEAKLARGATPLFRWALGGTLVGGLALTAVALSMRPAPTALTARPVWALSPDARFAASDEATSVALDDGSVIELDPHTSLRGVSRSAGEVTLELEHGEATFEVAHNPERSFRVASGDVSVRVIGTRFEVSREAGHVTVEVERGRVEVQRGEELVVLGAGQRWSGEEWIAHAEVEAPVPADAIEPEVTEVVGPAATPARRGAEGRDGERPRETEPEDAARALFEAAQAARRGGRPDRAAALFAELIEQHPHDPRAGLAAFELGRIRLDVMHDVRGSIEALERSLDLAPHGGFRQDALARLVLLYDRVGDNGRCREAQSRYLSDFPDGVHLSDVTSHCE